MKRVYLAVAIAVAVSGGLVAQSSSSASPRGKTTVRKSEYAIGHGSIHKKPRNYDAYYYSNFNGYELSPYLLTTPQYIPRVLTPVQQYTDLEYGKVVETFLKTESVAPAGMTSEEVRSVVQDDGDPLFGSHIYRPVETNVVEVLDRGYLVVGSREEIRLRGVRIASERNTDDVMRVYAREATRRIRELTQDQPVTLVLDSPLRDSDGAILAIARLKDGTELNRLLLKEGLAQLKQNDFAPDVNYDPLVEAERDARTRKRGIWSKDIIKVAP
ncbi:MAG: thermonuclease family protein [Candidatus Sumerlaeaceae bacterium]